MKWWQVARAQSGVISWDQLCRHGVSAPTVERMAATGELTRLTRGVYLLGGAPPTYAARLWAAHVATGGLLRHTTAGRLWGVYDGPDDLVHVVVEPDRHIAVPRGVRVRRSHLPPEARGLRSGLPCTTRTWTVLDLLGHLPRHEALRLADRALQREWIAEGDLERRLARYPKRRGNGQLRLLAERIGDGAAAESERVLHRLLRRAGVTGWVPNHPVWHDGELVGVLDVAIPGRRIAIEIDGMAYHVDVDRFRADRTKQNALVALGWTVLRFTWSDLTERPGYVIAVLQRLAA